MKLNKQQQQLWSTVTSVFGAVSRLSSDPAVIQGEMAQLIADFEVATDHEVKVKIRMLPTPSIDLIDCSRDSLKLNRDAEGSLTLRARVHGVGFSSTVSYKDSYAHSNVAIIDALRALADSLEKMPVEMCEQTAQSLDIYQLIGVSHSGGSDDDETGPEEPQKPAEKDGEEESEFPIQLVSIDTKDGE
jgi:hypothetical protein